MHYLVIARGNTSDVSLCDTPRFLTQDPRRALENARYVMGEDEDLGVLSDVLIFRINEDELYAWDDAKNYAHGEGKQSKILCAIIRPGIVDVRREMFYLDFADLCGVQPD